MAGELLEPVLDDLTISIPSCACAADSDLNDSGTGKRDDGSTSGESGMFDWDVGDRGDDVWDRDGDG